MDIGSPSSLGMLESLLPLVGVWTGTGVGGYPTITPFAYHEVLTINRDPDERFLTYTQDTELIDAEGRTLHKSHWEAGIIKFKENGTLELACVQGSGRMEVLGGKFVTDQDSPGDLHLQFQSLLITNDERVRASSREWSLSGDRLMYTMSMTTRKVKRETRHLEGTLSRA